MNAATTPRTPKKRSLMPAGRLRRDLRGHGHPLKPLVQVGKSGATKAVLEELVRALHDHELVKVRIGTECPQDRFEVADAIANLPGANVVQILGRTVLVYKRHPREPKYEGRLNRAARMQPERARHRSGS